MRLKTLFLLFDFLWEFYTNSFDISLMYLIINMHHVSAL